MASLQTVAKERLAKLLMSHLSLLTSCFVSALSELTPGVALVLHLPTLFPATSLLINQKSERIHFLPLLLYSIPDGRAGSALPHISNCLLPFHALL